MRYNIAEL